MINSGNEEEPFYTGSWFWAEFSFHCRSGGTFAVSRENFHIVERIYNQTLGMVIGVDLLKPQRAKKTVYLVYDVEKNGTDLLWVDGSFTILEMVPRKRYLETAEILREEGIDVSGFVKGRCIKIGSPSSNCLGV